MAAKADKGVRTLLETLAAQFALQARVGEPFDSDAIADFDRGARCVRADGDDLTDTLVAADQGPVRGKGPVALACVEVGVADARAVHLDETLAGREVLWLPDGVVVANVDGLIGGDDDGGLLCLRDVGHSSNAG